MSDAQIFQLFAIFYTTIGIGMLLNTAYYEKIFSDFTDNPTTLYIGGALALTIGYLIVALHYRESDFSVIITIIGWIALLKGIFILTLPKTMIAMTKAMTLNQSTLKILSIVLTIIGLALAFLGFCPKSPI